MVLSDWAFLIALLLCALILIRLFFVIVRHRHSVSWLVGNVVLSVLLIVLVVVLFLMFFPDYRLNGFGSMMFFII